MPTALLFDLDGTLVDSIELIVRSARHAFTGFEGRAPSDGIVPLVRELAASGSPMAIVTSKVEWLAERALAHVGLREAIPVVVGCDSCTRHKPHPEPVERALARPLRPYEASGEHRDWLTFKPSGRFGYPIQCTGTLRRSMTVVALPEHQTTAPPTPGADADVALAASGDRHAFERLYHLHVVRVFSLCARMVTDRTRAEELTQDVFVRAWEKLHLFRGEAAFGTWLHRLAVNVVLNARKSDGRQHGRFEGDDDGDGIASLAARHHAPGDRMDLEQAIGKLPRGARRVFTLHDVEGYKHEEIAELLGVTTGATKAQLHRARMLLRQALNR